MSTPITPNILRLMTPEQRASLGKAGMTPDESVAKQVAKNERELQTQIVNLLRLRGIEPCWHRTDKKSAATIGWPDITFAVVVTLAGGWVVRTPVAWEVKFGAGELSKEQNQMAIRLQSPPNGWRWREIRSVDQALAELKEIGV